MVCTTVRFGNLSDWTERNGRGVRIVLKETETVVESHVMLMQSLCRRCAVLATTVSFYLSTTSAVWKSDFSVTSESLLPTARQFELQLTVRVNEIAIRCVRRKLAAPARITVAVCLRVCACVCMTSVCVFVCVDVYVYVYVYVYVCVCACVCVTTATIRTFPRS